MFFSGEEKTASRRKKSKGLGEFFERVAKLKNRFIGGC